MSVPSVYQPIEAKIQSVKNRRMQIKTSNGFCLTLGISKNGGVRIASTYVKRFSERFFKELPIYFGKIVEGDLSFNDKAFIGDEPPKEEIRQALNETLRAI